jgi:hypothetical protein
MEQSHKDDLNSGSGFTHVDRLVRTGKTRFLQFVSFQAIRLKEHNKSLVNPL